MEAIKTKQEEGRPVCPQQVWAQLSGHQQEQVRQILSQVCQGLAAQQSQGKEEENDRDNEAGQ